MGRTRAELEQQYREGDRNFHGWDLSGLDLAGVSIPGAYLGDASLAGANLEQADLSRCVLKRADLSGCRFSNGKLDHANLKGANLTHSDFSGASLAGADLSRVYERAPSRPVVFTAARMDGSSLRASALEACTLIGASLRDASLENARLHAAKMEGADLAGASLEGASLVGAQMHRARFDRARLKDASLVDADLESASLVQTLLTGADLSRADLENSVMTECDLRRARLHGTSLVRTVLVGADLRDVDTSGESDFRGAVLDQAKMRAHTIVDIEGLSDRQRMRLDISDSLATLRGDYSGFWLWVHLLALALFVSPYFLFVARATLATAMSPHLPGSARSLGVELGWYVASGGSTHHKLSAWALVFVFGVVYNVLRGALLYKTHSLFLQHRISGLPLTYVLEHDPVWHFAYRMAKGLFAVNVLVAAWHLGLALSEPVVLFPNL